MNTLPEPDRSSEASGDNRANTPAGQAVRFLVIGRVLGPVGVDGEMRIQTLTDFPERFENLSSVHVGDNLRPYAIKKVRLESGENVLLKLEGVDTADAARAMRNFELAVPIDQAVRLEPDRFYWHEVVGLEVWTDTGENLGKVQQVLRTGQQRCLRGWYGSAGDPDPGHRRRCKEYRRPGREDDRSPNPRPDRRAPLELSRGTKPRRTTPSDSPALRAGCRLRWARSTRRHHCGFLMLKPQIGFVQTHAL